MSARVAEIRLGALYRYGARKRLGRAALVALLIDRCGLTTKVADQLTTHWLSTGPFKL